MELKRYLVDVADIYRVEVYAYTEEDAETYAKDVETFNDYREQFIHHMQCLGPAERTGEEGDVHLCNERADSC